MTLTNQINPMLAYSGKWSVEDIPFPVIASPKLDGERARVDNGVVLSRSLKPVKNRYIQQMLGVPELHGLDGELIVGSPTARDPLTGESTVRNSTRRGVGPVEGEPDFKLYVFDQWTRSCSFSNWLKPPPQPRHPHVEYVIQWQVETIDALLGIEQTVLARGYEGLVLCSPRAPYKSGRSTWNEVATGCGGRVKLKRFAESEAIVLAEFPLERNLNPKEMNELGHSKRSTHQAGKVADPTLLGTCLVRDLVSGVEFSVGTGWTQDERKNLMGHTVGRTMTYKHFPIGKLNKPNLPIWVSWRSPDDMGE